MGIQLFTARAQSKIVAARYKIFGEAYLQLKATLETVEEQDIPRYQSVASTLSENKQEQLTTLWQPVIDAVSHNKENIIDDSLYRDVIDGVHDTRQRAVLLKANAREEQRLIARVEHCYMWIHHFNEHHTGKWPEELRIAEEQLGKIRSFPVACETYEVLFDNHDDTVAYLNDMFDTVQRAQAHLTVLLEDAYLLLSQFDPEAGVHESPIDEDRSLEEVDQRSEAIAAALAKIRGV